MASKLRFRIVAGFAVFTILLGLYSARFWPRHETGTNFQMYYTAACLVRDGMSVHIYDVVDQNKNPQLLFADPSSVWARTARAHGISRITLYLYPPTLADLIVPLTLLPVSAAFAVWTVLNLLMIVGLSSVFTRMMDMNFLGATALVAALVLLYRPTLNTFHWGQTSILLAFLVTVGFGLYASGRKNIAALLFVLAIAIKLEPVILIIPLLAWRDWKCLRSITVWAILLSMALWAVNGGDALRLYFLHQLPAMASGKLGTGGFDVNRSLGNLFYTYLGGAYSGISSRALAWTVRLVSVFILGAAGWLSWSKRGEILTWRQQFEIGIIFLLLACCLSPYSWFYNWALSAPVIVMFYKRTWDGKANLVEIALLIALLLSLVTTRFNMALVSPVLGVALAIFALYRMRLERREESSQAVDPFTPAPAS